MSQQELTTTARQLIDQSNDAVLSGDYSKAVDLLEQAADMVVAAAELVVARLK